MSRHPVELQIEKADLAIIREDFDTLMDIYSDDAVLVVKPGLNAVGKVQIRKAMEANCRLLQPYVGREAGRDEDPGVG